MEGVDPDDLLVRWLGELLFQAETRRLAPDSIRFLRLGDEEMHAVCSMLPTGTPDCEIKAMTYHQSGTTVKDGTMEATLLFDV